MFYFELFEETISSGHVIVFLQHLVRHIPGKLLIAVSYTHLTLPTILRV